jgi:hypothetical protein
MSLNLNHCSIYITISTFFPSVGHADNPVVDCWMWDHNWFKGCAIDIHSPKA